MHKLFSFFAQQKKLTTGKKSDHKVASYFKSKSVSNWLYYRRIQSIKPPELLIRHAALYAFAILELLYP